MSEISKLYQFIAYIGINTADTKGNNDGVVTHQEFYNLATSDDYTDWAKKNYYDDTNCDHDNIKKPTRSAIDNVWKTFDIRNNGGDSDIVSANRTLVKNCGALDDKEFKEIEKVIQIHAAFNQYLEDEFFSSSKIDEHAPGLKGDYHNAWKGEVRDGLSEILEQLINQNTPADQIVSRIKASGEVDAIIKNATINAYKTQVLAETRKKYSYEFKDLANNSDYCIYDDKDLQSKLNEYINGLQGESPASILNDIQGIVDTYIKTADKENPVIHPDDLDEKLNELQSAKLQLHIVTSLKTSVLSSTEHAKLYCEHGDAYLQAFKEYAAEKTGEFVQREYKDAFTSTTYAYNGSFDDFIASSEGADVIAKIEKEIAETNTPDEIEGDNSKIIENLDYDALKNSIGQDIYEALEAKGFVAKLADDIKTAGDVGDVQAWALNQLITYIDDLYPSYDSITDTTELLAEDGICMDRSAAIDKCTNLEEKIKQMKDAIWDLINWGLKSSNSGIVQQAKDMQGIMNNSYDNITTYDQTTYDELKWMHDACLVVVFRQYIEAEGNNGSDTPTSSRNTGRTGNGRDGYGTTERSDNRSDDETEGSRSDSGDSSGSRTQGTYYDDRSSSSSRRSGSSRSR